METRKSTSGFVGLIVLIGIAVGAYYLFSGDGGGGNGSTSNGKIVGRWKFGEHDIVFGNDKSYKDNGRVFLYDSGEYSIDLKQNPAWINIVSRKAYNWSGFYNYFFIGIPKPAVANGIIRFVTDNEIEMVFSTKPTNDFGSGGVNKFLQIDQGRPSSFATNSSVSINTFLRNESVTGWLPVTFPSTENTIKIRLTRVLPK